jgi:hypothetical protein
MSSGRNGPESHPEIAIALPLSGGPPSSGTRGPPSSARAPHEHVAWGAVRDAITAIHNLEVLLKSSRIGTKVLAEVLHEFLAGVAVLRGTFGRSPESASDALTLAARRALADMTCGRLDELERTMQNAMTSDFDARGRLALEQVVTRVSVELDAAAELLDLSDRAESPAETELSLEELARVSLRGGVRGTDREIPVRLAPHAHDCVLRADPHVFKRLVAFAIARVHAAGVAQVTLRVHCGEDAARIEIGPTTAEETKLLLPTAVRLARRIAPTDAIVEAAARKVSITLTIATTPDPAAAMTISLEVPRAGQ